MATALELAAAPHDTFPINGTDYIEFYVGNAKQAAHFYQRAFGFQLVGYRGPETGVRDRASYLLAAGQDPLRAHDAIRPTSAPTASDRRARAASTATACATSRSGSTMRATRSRKRSSAARRRCTSRASCTTTTARSSSPAIKIYGDTIHSLVERKNYRGLFMPGFRRRRAALSAPPTVGLKYVDHCVGNVELGKMNEWVEFYAHVMGFRNLLTVRRQGHLDGVLVADVEGDGERERPHQVPDQRAGAGEEEVADRRVPRLLRRPRRAAPGARHGRHHRRR